MSSQQTQLKKILATFKRDSNKILEIKRNLFKFTWNLDLILIITIHVSTRFEVQ